MSLFTETVREESPFDCFHYRFTLPEQWDEEAGRYFVCDPSGSGRFTGWTYSYVDYSREAIASVDHFRDGLLDGPSLCLSESGWMSSLFTFKGGKFHGRAFSHYKSGLKRTEERYRENRLESLTVWQPDGSECPVSLLAGGKGARATYREDGSIEEVALIEDGKLKEFWEVR